MLPIFVICGIEHSGTTLVSDIFRQVPDIDAGFEVGVLLAETPRQFRTLNPFAANLRGGWKISEKEMDDICDTDSLDEFYQRLYDYSQEINKPCRIFDKTPRYFAELQNCQKRYRGKYIAMYKDPRSTIYSDYTRNGKESGFDIWYPNVRAAKLVYLRNIYTQYKIANETPCKNVLAVSLEELCLNTRETVERIFSHVGVEFRLDYLILNNLRYGHTRDSGISSKIAFEYKSGFSAAQQERIADDFAELKDWFYT